MRFLFEQLIGSPRKAVFAFHENPLNLAVVLRSWPGFRIIHHEGTIRVGSTVWLELQLATVVPVVLGFSHIVYDPPFRFSEQLIHGPFREFVHCHEFDETDGGTVVRDVLDVSLPWQYGGRVTMRAFVARYIQRVFALRAQALEQLATEGAVELL